MTGKRIDGVVIHVNPAGAVPPLGQAQLWAALVMACRACGHEMRRGGQCPRCGAWCR